MSINREIVLGKLNAYLGNTLSKEALYEWALSVAVSGEYQVLAGSDPLVHSAVNAMIEIKHKDPAKFSTAKTLEYYRRCLAGELAFNSTELPLDGVGHKTDGSQNVAIPKIQKPVTPQTLIQSFQEWKYFKDAILSARLYVLVFAVCSFVVQVSSIISPGFMQIGLRVPSRWEALADAFPHLIYAYFVLLPPQRLFRGKMFLIALPIFIVGMMYYWKLSFLMVTKLSLDWVFILAILPFSAIPATLALLLLLAEKFGLTKPKTSSPAS